MIPGEIVIEAVVAASERPALETAVERLGACLDLATGEHWVVQVRFLDTLAEVGSAEPPSFVLVSLLPELERSDDPLALVAARLRAFLETLSDRGAPVAFLCTIFRHVASVSDRWQTGSPPASIERIRRLNLLAAETSQATGANVIDFDRVFAHVGARALQTDYRLGGTLAAGLAADIIVATLLTAGFAQVLPPEAEERAREIHAGRSAAALGHALSVSARSLRFETSRQFGVRQTFAAVKPVLSAATARELVRDVRHRRATVRAVAPIILRKLLRRVTGVPK